MKRSLLFILIASLLWLTISPARRLPAKQASEANQYALSNGATIQLSTDWTSRTPITIPPPASLASSAPPLKLYDFQVFQNIADHSQVEFALSNNPFLGRDAYWLDAEMHRPPATGEGMLSYLFYFFFPPPPPCLDGASLQYDKTSRESASNSDGGTQPNVKISFDCQYAPVLPDFYSFFVSGTVTFRRESSSEHREGALRDLYLLPMVTEEFNGLTFYLFEAQGRRQISLATTDRFNLPDSLQGAQPDFLWAIGAPSPFPFVQDVTRKRVPLLHVVYAGVAVGANKKPDFLRILRTVQMPRL
ncbi:MAG: hypothetical protein WBR10_14045 [Candidatus Acidiferrum sp.]